MTTEIIISSAPLEEDTSVDKKVLDDYFDVFDHYQEKYGPKTVLLYQIGNFYEAYGYTSPNRTVEQNDFVKDYAYILGLKLTHKKMTYKSYPLHMAGFTFKPWILEKHKEILLQMDYTVVVYIESTDDSGSSQRKKRVLEGVYSPGTYIPTEITTTTTSMNPHIVSIWIRHYRQKLKPYYVTGIAIFNVVTNNSYIMEYDVQEDHLQSTTFDDLERILSIYRPKEVILISSVANTKDYIPSLQNMYVHEYNPNMTIIQNAEKQRYVDHLLTRHFGPDVLSQCAEIAEFPLATQAFVVLLHFLEEHNPNLCKNIRLPHWESESHYTKLANNSLIQLNIINSDKSEHHHRVHNRKSYQSVVSLLDHCKTNMGSRLLYQYLTHPIFYVPDLKEEYNTMSIWINNKENEIMMTNLRKQMGNIYDIDHHARLVTNQKITPTQMSNLYSSISIVNQIWTCMAEHTEIHDYVHSGLSYQEVQDRFQSCLDYLDERFNWSWQDGSGSGQESLFSSCMLKATAFPKLRARLLEAEQCDIKWNTIWMFLESLMNPSNPIKEGFVKREINEKRGIVAFQMTQTRAKTLQQKIKLYMKDHHNLSIVKLDGGVEFDIGGLLYQPSTKKGYTFLQNTLLHSLSSQYQGVHQELQTLVQELYLQTIQEFESKFYGTITLVSAITARMDVLWTKCKVSIENNYCCPTIEKYKSDIPKSYVRATGLRHVLIEKILRHECYVPNDVTLGNDETNGILLFGTNAVGKTSLMRALGIAVIMAQAGMYVPCTSFTYYPYESIFTRILNQDNLFKGMSTFEVEMSELRLIQDYANGNSLVLGDELCSGTENTSAVCIILATLMRLYDRRSSFLLATHFHEIVKYEELKSWSTIRLCHLSVQYNSSTDSLEYERRLQDGPGMKNYGLEVCKSLHMDTECLEKAYQIRSKYFPEFSGSLQLASSRYNVEKLRSLCELCGVVLGKETHHLQEQHTANARGFIDTVHKNHMGNLMSLCEACHDKVHHHHHHNDDPSPLTDDNYSVGSVSSKATHGTQTSVRRVKTTKGYVIKTS